MTTGIEEQRKIAGIGAKGIGKVAAKKVKEEPKEEKIVSLTKKSEDILREYGYPGFEQEEPVIEEEPLPMQPDLIVASLPNIFPELELSQENPVEVINSLQQIISESPDDFIISIQDKGRNFDTENLLVGLGMTSRDINSVFLPDTFKSALPLLVRDTNKRDMADYFLSNPDSLRRNLITAGLNSKTEELVRILFPGITDEQILSYFSQKSLVLEKEAAQARTGFGAAFTAGTGDLVANVGGALKWLGADGIGEKISDVGQFMQVQLKPDELGEFQWKHLFNSDWWMNRGVRMLPTLMTLAIPGIGGYGLAGSIAGKFGLGTLGTTILTGLGGAALSRPMEGAMEAGAAYDQARAKGMSHEEAEVVANKVFLNNLKLAGVDALQLSLAFAPYPARLFGRLADSGLFKTAIIGGKLAFTGLTEGGEEVYQEIITRQALGEKIEWNAELQEVFALGAAAGIGMGGGADIITRITNRTVDKLTPELKQDYDIKVDELKLQGINDREAKNQALNDLMEENPELEAIVEDVTRTLDLELTVNQLEPRSEGDEVVIDNIKKKLVEEGRVEAEAIGYTPPVEKEVFPADNIIEKQIKEANKIQDFPLWKGKGFRVDIENWGIPKGATAADVVRFEIEELENETRLSPKQIKLLEQYEAGDVIWIAKSKEAATDYLSEGMTESDITEYDIQKDFGEGSRIIDLDYQDGYLILRGDAIEPAPEAPEAEISPPEPVVEEIAAEPVSTIGDDGVIIEAGGTPVSPDEVIPAGVADHSPILKDIGAKEKVRPVRKVLARIGLWRELYKPIQKAEVEMHEEKVQKQKEVRELRKMAGKDKERWALIFREVNEKGSQVGLTFDEKRVVSRIRKWADDWAERKNLDPEKRIKDYIPHLFEQEMAEEIKGVAGIDPIIASMISDKTIYKITDPFLKRRLGAVGFIEDPFAAMEAYDTVSLRSLYYSPMLDKMDSIMHDPNTPPGVASYLKEYSRRMTGEISSFDKSMNITIQEFAEFSKRVMDKYKIPGGDSLYQKLTVGNPIGRANYNLTSALYVMWLGGKATSAIRNLSQHTLIIGEVGIESFGEAVTKTLTAESKAAIADSLVARSRRQAFVEGLDSSFQSRFQRTIADKALILFRAADKLNVRHAFLAGYYEAKRLLPDADRQVWIDRGDEVAADTQYLYTKMNSPAWTQDSRGRVLSMLTSWTTNWMELMTKWVARRPSQVYLEYEQATGAKVSRANWSTSYKAIGMYLLIIALAYYTKEHSRLKAFEYTGLTSINYLADIIGGDFPALQYPGDVANVIAGFLTDDERRMKQGLNALKPIRMIGILRQIDDFSQGEKDWLNLLFYVEGKDINVKRLKERWSKEFKQYENLSVAKVRTELYPTLNANTARKRWREENPLTEAKMFIVGQFTTLSSEEARQEVLRLIEENRIDTELIPGYKKVFLKDSVPELNKIQNRLGRLQKLVIGEEAEYVDMGMFAEEVHKMVNTQGRGKIMRDGHPLAVELLNAEDLWKTYDDYETDDARKLWRQQFPDGEAQLYLWGKIGSFENPNSATELLRLMEKYSIPPEAINAFQQDPDKYDDLFTQKFELQQKNYELTNTYENFGNKEAPNYIEDKEQRKLGREKFKEDNPNWVADMRRIEAIDNDASPELIEKWVERGRVIDEYGASSSQSKVWLLDNPDVHQWALDNKLIQDDGADWNEDRLRINVQMEKLDKNSAEYKVLKRKDEAYAGGFGDYIDEYLKYYDEYTPSGYKRDRMLYDKSGNLTPFGKALSYESGIKITPFSEIPDIRYDELLEKETRTQLENWEMEGYLLFIGKEKLVPDYVNYKKIISIGKPASQSIWFEDDWYLLEHPDFYKTMVQLYKDTGGKEGWKEKPKSYWEKIPPRDIFEMWLVYDQIKGTENMTASAAREEYRRKNPRFDAWGVLYFGWTPAPSGGVTTRAEQEAERASRLRSEIDKIKKEIDRKLKALGL